MALDCSSMVNKALEGIAAIENAVQPIVQPTKKSMHPFVKLTLWGDCLPGRQSKV